MFTKYFKRCNKILSLTLFLILINLNFNQIVFCDETTINNSDGVDITEELAFNIDENLNIKKIVSSGTTPQPPPPPPAPKFKLNETHATIFKTWLNSKSDELYDLTKNYTGYEQLNETYNIHLTEDAKPAWINFTSMIIEISDAISEVLYNKTEFVKQLQEKVEEAFNDYKNDTEKVLESTNYIYYDAKSPKTFCDVAKTYEEAYDEEASKLMINDTYDDYSTEGFSESYEAMAIDSEFWDIECIERTFDENFKVNYLLITNKN
jgi:hypothetical protein